MTRRILIVLLAGALGLGLGLVGWRLVGDERTAAALIQQASETPVTIEMKDGVPRFVRAEVRAEGATPADRSYGYLERFRELYSLEAPRHELEVADVASSEGVQHVRLEQHAGEIPVHGGELVVHLDGQEVVATNGTYLAKVPELEPRLRAEEALETARTEAGIVEAGEAKPELAYFDADLLMTPEQREASGVDGETHLAWVVDLTGGGADKEWIARRVFVDATTGDVLLGYSLIQSHAPNKDIWIRTANSNGQWACGFWGSTDWWVGSQQLAHATPDAEGIAAFQHINTVYDYFFNTFHRHSFNGGDKKMALILDVVWPPLLPEKNAGFIHFCDHMIFNDNMARLDIVAHEFTHGVTADRLASAFEPGALHEHISDTFAVLIDSANWTIGEGTAAGSVRHYQNPNLNKMPLIVMAANDDNGGVHINANIPNKAGSLMMAGGFHNGRNVSPLGRPKVEQLYYEVLFWVGKNSSFADFRNVMVSATSALATLGRHGFTPADSCKVVNAFAAVEIAVGDADCDGTFDSTDTDDDNDALVDTSDNCQFIVNPGQEKHDGDAMGDACDTDDDGDTVLDEKDNCRTVPNKPQFTFHSQDDADSDGIGDVCDPTPNGDKDGDGVDTLTDNCDDHVNPDQKNSDDDPDGDVCDADDDGDTVLDGRDNCPLKPNTDQKDTDGDGSGDACDPTPKGPDLDLDGIPDDADPDDDNDQVNDDADNCPRVKNSSQIDLDHDGTGHECDSDESLTPQRPLLSDAIDQRTRRFERIEIPVLPCLEECEPDVPMEIRLEVDIPLTMRLLDESGTVIAEGSNEKPLVFEPKDDLQYQLEILPRDVTLTEDHPLELELVPRP